MSNKLQTAITMMSRGYEWSAVTMRLGLTDDGLRDLLRGFGR